MDNNLHDIRKSFRIHQIKLKALYGNAILNHLR